MSMNDSADSIALPVSSPNTEDRFPDSPPNIKDSLRHIPSTVAASVLFTVMAVIAAGWYSGGTAVLGVLAGSALVAVSYGVSTLMIAACEVVDRRLILPVGVAVYAAKMALFGVILALLAKKHWAGLPAMGLAVIGAVIIWSVTHLWWTVRRTQSDGTLNKTSTR